jgi:hypothetical protein
MKDILMLLVLAPGIYLAGCAATEAGPMGSARAVHPASSLADNARAVEIHIESKPAAVSEQQLQNWISTAARAVSNYYGRFPVQHVAINVSAESRGHDINGRTFNGERINLILGTDLTSADLKNDWVLTHEMFHLAFPDLAEDHNWMNEGLSTYLEPVARARIGTLGVKEFWKETVEGMPQGLPEQGDQGLDRTHTWGRTYWGGCMYWLMADIQIREQTRGKRSLQDALRAILNAGGDGSKRWQVTRVFEVGDRATGTTVLRDLYDQMALKPDPIDLEALWRKLGIVYRDGQLVFDNHAPLAFVREAITSNQAPAMQ